MHSRRPPMRPAAVAGVLACTLLAACGGGSASPPSATLERVTIDGARKSGLHATAVVKGIVARPAGIAIRVSAAPRQRVEVTWGLSCPRTDTGKDKGTGGTYTAKPPNVHALKLPRRTIAFCAVRAEVRLSQSGRARAALLATRR
ncbi:MAG TPA: hypothetical protein VGF63_10510 [Solirubrobacteraceae bacterium]